MSRTKSTTGSSEGTRNKGEQFDMNAALELEYKTREYWVLSMKWNGRISERISCGKALDITRELVCTVNPSRPLIKSVLVIEDEIIRNKKRTNPKSIPNNKLDFKPKHTQAKDVQQAKQPKGIAQ